MIPNVELTKDELHKLLACHKVMAGSEAIICESNNPYTLYKVFWNFNKKIPMNDNKVKKINLLYQKQLEYSIIPISTISFNDMIIGYEMTTDPGLQSYKLYQLKNDELLYFLKETKKILEYFTKQGIIYGDIAPRNILFNRDTGEIVFCDMDNIQIGNYAMDIIPNQLLEYSEKRGIDEDVHPFMHNIITMESYQLYLHYCSDYIINKHFHHPARKIIHSMEKPLNFDGEYLIKYKKKNK